MQQNKNKVEGGGGGGGLSKRKLKRLMIEEKILSKAKKYMKEDVKTEEIQQESNDQQMKPKPKKAKKKKVKKLAEKSLPFGVTDEMDEDLAVKKLSAGEVNVIGGDGGGEIDKKKKRRKKKKKPKKDNLGDSTSAEKDSKNIIEEGLNFLIKWENDKSNWKFEKLKQIWLIKNSLKPKIMPDQHFEVFLRFISTMKGQSRIQTKLEMQKFANDYESKFLSKTSTVSSEKEKEKPSKVDKLKYERSKQMIQILSDD